MIIDTSINIDTTLSENNTDQLSNDNIQQRTSMDINLIRQQIKRMHEQLLNIDRDDPCSIQ
jgi:hypothetical protein